MLLARAHGVPVPEPVYLDETGSVLGVPGIVTRFVEGKQWSDRQHPAAWAATLARLLLKIHDISPKPDDRKKLLDGNYESMYFLREDQPQSKAGYPLSDVIYDTVRAYSSSIPPVTTSLIHLDYWPGNVLWRDGQVTAIVDWDFASYGDPALDVAYFRMDMHLRGIREAAKPFLECYEAESGAAVKNLGFWELAAAAHPLPKPVAWIPASREMGDMEATDERGETAFVEFVHNAVRRTHAGR
jgi:aminoglycoside phosphotransferase (APT) family kinase protein